MQCEDSKLRTDRRLPIVSLEHGSSITYTAYYVVLLWSCEYIFRQFHARRERAIYNEIIAAARGMWRDEMHDIRNILGAIFLNALYQELWRDSPFTFNLYLVRN